MREALRRQLTGVGLKEASGLVGFDEVGGFAELGFWLSGDQIPIFARSLRQIKRLIRGGKYRIRAVAIAERNADGSLERQTIPIPFNRLTQTFQNAFRELGSIIHDRAMFRHDHKFIAADPRGKIDPARAFHGVAWRYRPAPGRPSRAQARR